MTDWICTTDLSRYPVWEWATLVVIVLSCAGWLVWKHVRRGL